jgi:hypothetical protein
MAKFLVTCHGGGEPPADPAMREQMMAAFGSLADAIELVRSHPFVSRGGTLRVSEAVAP